VDSFLSPSTWANDAPSHQVTPALTAAPFPPVTPPKINSPPQLPLSRGSSSSDNDEGPVGVAAAAGVPFTLSPQEAVAIAEAMRPAINAARECI
jgi:hypothetical protein